MLREGVCQLLQSERDFAVAATAEDGLAALSVARECRPDVLLLEFDLPKLPGLRVLELLDTTATRVLLFGASIPSDTAIEALELGARGALQHDQSAALLFKSIRTVAKGEYWVDRALVGKLARQVQFATTPFRLTARQRQVVSLLVAGYSNKEIAERFKLSSNTVKHHLTSIFDKTGASTRVELAVFACTTALRVQIRITQMRPASRAFQGPVWPAFRRHNWRVTVVSNPPSAIPIWHLRIGCCSPAGPFKTD